jgi:multiple RNA-binding domain-containing protein 1
MSDYLCYQGTVLEGHALALQLSHSARRGGETDSTEVKGGKKGGKSESSTKIIVRNVAFEATRKDLQKLFNPFGQVSTHPSTSIIRIVILISFCQ